MDRYSYRLLKWIKGTKSAEEIQDHVLKWKNCSYYFALLNDLEERGFVKHTDTGYLVEENRKPVPVDAWYITFEGVRHFQEAKHDHFWRILPFIINGFFTAIAIVISIIALLKP